MGISRLFTALLVGGGVYINIFEEIKYFKYISTIMILGGLIYAIYWDLKEEKDEEEHNKS